MRCEGAGEEYVEDCGCGCVRWSFDSVGKRVEGRTFRLCVPSVHRPTVPVSAHYTTDSDRVVVCTHID